MRVMPLLCLVLISCAHPEKETTPKVVSSELRPAIRELIVPGTTYANTTLQRETIEAARQTFKDQSDFSQCTLDGMSVSDTWPLGAPTLSEHTKAFTQWRELWTFEVCGSSFDAEIVYMLHRDTGIINMRLYLRRDTQAVSIG